MLTSKKAFVVLHIPSPWKEAIQAIRDELNTVTAKLPVEITVAGSAGVGPIPEGTPFELIRSEVDRIARVTALIVMEFGAISRGGFSVEGLSCGEAPRPCDQ